MPVTHPMNSIQKLNKLVQLFIDGDNKKLDRAETDALAGYYGGLPDAGKTKVRDRVIEVYQKSTFANGEQARFRDALQGAGLKLEDLEGTGQITGASVLKMSKGAQLDTLSSYEQGFDAGTSGVTKDIQPRDAARVESAKIKTALSAFDDKMKRKYAREDDFALGDKEWRAIYRESDANDRPVELLGYAVKVGIYAEDHDVDRTVYFNIKGDQVGDVYSGE